ncbi:RnaseH-domain-containing protein, partial [Mycena olivaceomarginata]
VQNSPRQNILHFKAGSSRLIKSLTTGLPGNEDSGWLGVENSVLLKTIVAVLRGRGSRCTFQKVDDSDPNMVKAKEMARDAPEIGQPIQLQTVIPPAFCLEGMKLSEGSQRTFYRHLKNRRKTPPERLKTTIMLDRTRYAAARLSGKTPTDSKIWQAINHKDITRTTRAFLWRTLHQAYKIGEYWRNKPTFEHYAECRHCRVDDSMEHSLVECDAPGREQLWNLAKSLWEKKGYEWPEVSIGSILACGFSEAKSANGKKDRGADQLYRTLISETAHQIWKLRCIRVIERGSDPLRYFSEAEIHNKWLACINSRLRSDIILTDQKKFGNRALNFKVVCSTWNGILKDNENLTGTKIGQSRVLVGIAPLCPPGQNQ